MTALIVWACIIGYLGIAAWMHPKFALRAYKNGNKQYPIVGFSTGEAATFAALHAIFWPITIFVFRSEKYIEREIEFEAEMEKIREQIKDRKRLDQLKTKQELEAFDQAMKEEL